MASKVLKHKRARLQRVLGVKPSTLAPAPTPKMEYPVGREPLKALAQRIPEWGMKRIRLSDLLPTGASTTPEWTTWDYDRACEEGYIGNLWTYVAIYRIVQAIGQPTWRVEEMDSGGAWEPMRKHPAAMLLKRPNPLETRRTFLERCALHLLLGGKGNQSIVRKGGDRTGVPVELWNIRPDRIAPLGGQSGSIKPIQHYTIKDGNGSEVDERVENIIPLSFVDPQYQLRAVAPIQAAGRDIDIDREQSEWQKASMENRAVVSGILSFEHRLNQTQIDEIRDGMVADHQGAANALDIFILGNNAKFHPMAHNPVEMDYVRSKKLEREAILAAFGVPPVVAGIFENATLANAEASWVAFWLNTVIPLLDLIRDYWQEFLIEPNWGEDVRLIYDVSKIAALLPLFRENAQMVERYWRQGVPMEELNRRFDLGFRPFPGWERSYVQSKYVGLGEDGMPIVIESNLEDPQTDASLEGQMENTNGQPLDAQAA